MEAVNKENRSETAELGRGALRLLAAGAIAFALESCLDTYRLAYLLMGVFAIEFLIGKGKFRWDETGKRSSLQSVRVVGIGFVLSASMVLVLVGIASVLGLARVSLGSPTWVGAGMGLVMAFAQAARDELLFRGAPLTLMRGKVSDPQALVFVALLGGAPLVLQPGASMVGVVMVVVLGWTFALAWRVGKGMSLVLGAHAGLLFMLGAGTRGSVLNVSLGQGQLLPLVDASGTVAWLALAVFAVAALLSTLGYHRFFPKPSRQVGHDVLGS